MSRQRVSALMAFAALAAVLIVVPAGSSSRLSDVALTVKIEGHGSVTGTRIDCHTGNTGTCEGTFPEDTTENFTATADAGWTFAHWDGECTRTTNVCDVYFGSDSSLKAIFTQSSPPTRTLTVSVSGSGKVTATGIDCGNGASDCTESYTDGTQVTLTASPVSGATFSGWGGACSGSASTCGVTMNGDKSVSATFVGGGVTTRTMNVSVSGSGKVTGTGIDCGN